MPPEHGDLWAKTQGLKVTFHFQQRFWLFGSFETMCWSCNRSMTFFHPFNLVRLPRRSKSHQSPTSLPPPVEPRNLSIAFHSKCRLVPSWSAVRSCGFVPTAKLSNSSTCPGRRAHRREVLDDVQEVVLVSSPPHPSGLKSLCLNYIKLLKPCDHGCTFRYPTNVSYSLSFWHSSEFVSLGLIVYLLEQTLGAHRDWHSLLSTHLWPPKRLHVSAPRLLVAPIVTSVPLG